MSSAIVLLLAALTIVLITGAQSGKADPSALLEHILDNYDKRIRPYAGDNEIGGEKPVMIEMTIVLAILTELVWDIRFVSMLIDEN